MGICENQYTFVKNNALNAMNDTNIEMLELGDQILNNHRNVFRGIKTAKEWYTNLGYNHTSFDWNGNNGSIPVDLTKLDDKYNNKYNIITNHGTSEHVHNQYNLFKNLHNWGKLGCIYIHCVPLEGEEHKKYLGYEFPPHGDYEYSSIFWKELANANNYTLMVSDGNCVSNMALNYPKNNYSASAYKKVNDEEFIDEKSFQTIFNKYCRNTTNKLSLSGHNDWKNSLPIDIRNKYKI